MHNALSRTWLPACVALLALWAGPAQAADVVSPRDGDTVPSRPEFAFDFGRGYASIELARTPETKTAGDQVGRFVDPYADGTFVIGGEFASGPPYVLDPILPERLEPGRYFWHARLDDYADDDREGGEPPVTWGPLRTLMVRDEPILFEGWAIQAKRVKRTRRCARVVKVTGTLAYSDNSSEEKARYTIKLASGQGLVRLRGSMSDGGDQFEHLICTKLRAFAATPYLRDGAGQVTPGDRRSVIVK